MIKVLIAEDEPPIMRANATIIESTNSKFKIVARAINGQKAIEELQKQKIDVVFTDIRMPIIDGLDLANYIKINYPNIITVITSGYSDFEYARKGIEFKVYDYLLKPVSKSKILNLLNNIEREIAKKNNEAKKKMLFDRMDKTDLHTPDPECIIILACAGSLPVYGNDVLVPAAAFWNQVSLENIVPGILKGGEEYMIFTGTTMAEKIITIESSSADCMKSVSEELFNILIHEDLTITLGCTMGIKMSEINKVIGTLRDEIIRRLILTKSQILYLNDLLENYSEVKYSKDRVESIVKCLIAGDSENVRRYVLQTFETMEISNATQEDIINFFDMIINHYYFNADFLKKKISVVKRDLYETINNFIDYYSMSEDVTSVLLNIAEINKEKFIKKPKLIENIEEYLKLNYQKSITNAVLSKEFGFVPSYISRLFRQYNDGVSPGEYLGNYRIEKAKKIMKENPEILVKEIADMVGFNDAYYFSKIFKKKTGMWPTKYYGNKKENEIV